MKDRGTTTDWTITVTGTERHDGENGFTYCLRATSRHAGNRPPVATMHQSDRGLYGFNEVSLYRIDASDCDGAVDGSGDLHPDADPGL